MTEIKVAKLNFYPIKSCEGIEADEVTFSELGIRYDREWMLVGKNNQFLSQRVHPNLAVVQTRIDAGALIVEAPGMGELTVPLERDPLAEIVPVDLFKKPGSGTDAGADAKDYFSDYLGKETRLIQVLQPRTIKPECKVEGAADKTGFADGFPILLTSILSLDALNACLKSPIPMNRFRPNIVVEGAPEYDEDYWRELQIGNLSAYVVRACARCPIPNIDQQIGERAKERPVTEALRRTRGGIDPVNGSTGEFFGQNIVHVFEPGTTIKVGDTVSLVARSDDRNVQLTAP